MVRLAGRVNPAMTGAMPALLRLRRPLHPWYSAHVSRFPRNPWGSAHV